VSSSQQWSYCRTRVVLIPLCFPSCRLVFQFACTSGLLRENEAQEKWPERIEAYGTVPVLFCPTTLKIYVRTTIKKVIRQWYDEIYYVIVSSEIIHQQRFCPKKILTINSKLCIWRWQFRASSYNSNKLINQMQPFYKFITWGLCVAQHVSGASTPIIRSLQLH
jgi:hypothetical protein